MAPRTLLESLIQKLRGCNVHGDAEESPVAILWTDPRSEWKPLIPLLRQQLPEPDIQLDHVFHCLRLLLLSRYQQN